MWENVATCDIIIKQVQNKSTHSDRQLERSLNVRLLYVRRSSYYSLEMLHVLTKTTAATESVGFVSVSCATTAIARNESLSTSCARRTEN